MTDPTPGSGGSSGGGVPGGPAGSGTGGVPTGGVPSGGASGGVPTGGGGVPAGGGGVTGGGGPAGGPVGDGTPGGIVAGPPPFGLTQGELAVLRKIATDPDFRVAFASDPVLAVTSSNITLTTVDLTRLEKLSPQQLEMVAVGIQALAGAATAGSGLQSEGTHTLVYAIIVALLLA